MRSVTKLLALNTLLVAFATSLGAQGAAPRRPAPASPPAQAQGQAGERLAPRRVVRNARERVVARRLAMAERQAARRVLAARRVRAGVVGPAFRAGVRAGVRAGARAAAARAEVRRDIARSRVASLTPAQRAQLREHRQALQAERTRIRDAVRAGTMTRDQAREQMRAWREQHRPNVRPPGGGAAGE